MKQIILALAIAAIAGTSAQAQTCNTVAKKTVKHKAVVHRNVTNTTTNTNYTGEQGTALETTECRLVPYQVCAIGPDRRSVSCYKTTDLNGLTPLDDETTYYGPSGPVPGAMEDPGVKTIVIKGETTGDYCKREGRDLVCRYSGRQLYRDANGFYNYR